MMRGPSRIVAAGALLLGTAGPTAAATYRWVDDDGVIHLTNIHARFEAHRQRGTTDQAGPAPGPPPKGSASNVPSDLSKFKEGVELRRMESVTTEVMRLSGLTVQVDLLAMMILGEFDHLRSLGLQPTAGAAPLVAQTFSADPLRSNMHEALARSLQPERTRALLAWLRTPLSERIVSFECALPTADRQAELTDFVNRLPSTPPAPARLTLIHRLERAGDVTQGAAVVLTAAGAALRRTLKPFLSPAVMAQPTKGGQQADPTIDENARLRTMVSLLFTYRDLSDAELARYVSFLESPTGRWFTRLTQSAFLVSLDPFDQPRRAGATTAAGKRPNPTEAAFTASPKN